MLEKVINIDIGEAIQRGMKKKGMSQRDLAKTMDVSVSLVSAWVRNQRVPTGKDLIKLAITLDIVSSLFPGYIKSPQKFDSDLQQSPQDKYFYLTKEIEKLRREDHRLEQKIQRLEKILAE